MTPIKLFATAAACLFFSVKAAASPFAYVSALRGISVVDLATNAVVSTIDLNGASPGGVGVNPTGTRVYVGGSDRNIYVIDATTNTPIAAFSLGTLTIGLPAVAPSGKEAYACGNGKLWVIDTTSNTVLASIAFPDGISGGTLAVAPSGDDIYVVDVLSNSLLAIDLRSRSVAARATVSGVTNVAVSTDSSTLYATIGTGSVAMIDARTLTPKGSIFLGSTPSALAVDPLRPRIYATMPDLDAVFVLDTVEDNLAARISVGKFPLGISITPDGGRVVAVNYFSDSASVIETDSNTVVATVSVGEEPAPIGQFITAATDAPPGVSSGSLVSVVEFYHAAFDHYFISSNSAEVAALDSGLISGWSRTGQQFLAYAIDRAPVSALSVCRFFSAAFAPKSSHFYGYGNECFLLQEHPESGWQFEGEVFKVTLPTTGASCPGASQPVYRLYNNGQGGAPNHRYTTSLAIRSDMIALGWISEGYGPLGVEMCAPVP